MKRLFLAVVITVDGASGSVTLAVSAACHRAMRITAADPSRRILRAGRP